MVKTGDEKPDIVTAVGCLVPCSLFFFAVLAPTIGASVAQPLHKVAALTLRQQELNLGSALYVFGFMALSFFECSRLLWNRRKAAPTGYAEVAGSFESDWSSGLEEASGLLLDAESNEEKEAGNGCVQGCILSVLFSGLSVAYCSNASPDNSGGLLLLLATGLAGLLLWGNFFRRLHRVHDLEHWLQFDFSDSKVTWVQRRKGRQALNQEALANPKLVLKKAPAGLCLWLVHGQGQELSLVFAFPVQAAELAQFAKQLARRARLPFEDLRED